LSTALSVQGVGAIEVLAKTLFEINQMTNGEISE